jgi:hypothetical protein
MTHIENFHLDNTSQQRIALEQEITNIRQQIDSSGKPMSDPEIEPLLNQLLRLKRDLQALEQDGHSPTDSGSDDPDGLALPA